MACCIVTGITLTTFNTSFTAVFRLAVFPAMNPAEMHTLTRQFTVHFQGILDDVFDQENIIEWLGIEIISGEAVEALKAVA